MHLFGERCFVLKSNAKKSGKLDTRSKPVLLIGYQSGMKDTYKISCENKVVLSRNVRFVGLEEKEEKQENLSPNPLGDLGTNVPQESKQGGTGEIFGKEIANDQCDIIASDESESPSTDQPTVSSRALTLRTFVGCHLRSCVLHARMSGAYAHSMAALSTAEDRLSSLGRSSSVPFTAGMGIDLRGPYSVPFSSKVLDRNSVVVP